ILASWLGTQLRAPGKPIARISVSHDGPFLSTGTTVVLDGTQSQYATSFAWRQTAGPQVALTEAAPDGSKVSFVAPAGPASLSFELVASIAGRSSDPANATLLVPAAAGQPRAVGALAG